MNNPSLLYQCQTGMKHVRLPEELDYDHIILLPRWLLAVAISSAKSHSPTPGTGSLFPKGDGPFGTNSLVRWTVTRHGARDSTQSQSAIYLEEDVSVPFFRFFSRLAKLDDDFNSKTKRLLESLNGMAELNADYN